MNTHRRDFFRLALRQGGATVAAGMAATTALHASTAGYTFTGSSSSSGSWSFVNEWTEAGGFRWVGPVRYKVDKLHKRYQRTQYRTDHYEKLTVVVG